MTGRARRGGNVSVSHRKLFAELILGIGMLLSEAIASPARGDEEPESFATGTEPQAECPVMVGNKLDSSIFVDYEGKRVFFCCAMCRSAFLETPEKYLPRLAQFAGVAGGGMAHEHADHEHAGGAYPARLVVPMGVVTLSLVSIAVGLGAFWKRLKVLKPRTALRLHKIVGASALVSGAIHATLVLLAN